MHGDAKPLEERAGFKAWKRGTLVGAIKERKELEEQSGISAAIAAGNSGLQFSTEAMGLAKDANRHFRRIVELLSEVGGIYE